MGALSLFFEGAEKKAELQIYNDGFSLLKDIKDDFWHELVSHCNAKILSTISNQYCKAFLLSESSLFVWEDRFLILTCGETKLINSVEFFINSYGKEKVRQLTYQRKNEYFSHAQPSCFGDDVKLLNQYFEGQAYRFGALDSHHNFIFHYEDNYVADEKDQTFEFLAYQISEKASRILSTPGLTREDIRALFNFEQIIPGFEIDDFVFDPYGYSLNAILDDKYLTIHVTPQETSSYVSFEANIDLIALAPKLIEVLEPNSFDILTYNEFEYENKIKTYIPEDYIACSLVEDTFSNGYQVKFGNFLKPAQSFKAPVKINKSGEDNVL